MTAPTRNRFDFIAFLDQLEAEIPVGQQVIAILDNLSTHKPRRSRTGSPSTRAGSSSSPQSTPPGSTRSRSSSRSWPGGCCAAAPSPAPTTSQLKMLAFVEHYDLTAKPFAWTHTGKVLAA